VCLVWEGGKAFEIRTHTRSRALPKNTQLATKDYHRSKEPPEFTTSILQIMGARLEQL
jgi:hypothetical protein